MVNMAVPYSRPDRASLTLWNEVVARYGARAQNKGFVTGYKAPGNVTSHNADAHGVTHAVDLGVDIEGDGSGIPVAEAESIALQICRSGKAKYVIYNRRIASVNTGWEWWAYTGASPHLDHIHVSTAWDFYWGDPCPTPNTETDSMTGWGIAGINPAGGGTITPIEEDDLPYSREELIQLVAEAVQPAHDVTRDVITERTQAQHDVTRSFLLDKTQAQADVTRGYLVDRIREASPQVIVDAIPAEVAQAVLDGLTARLQAGGSNG